VPAADKADTVKALSILGFTRERLFSDIDLVVRNFKADL
jgi:hypothetical protein